MSNKNVLYVEPNYTDSIEGKVIDNGYDTNQVNTYEFAPQIEDYCVSVDLEVEIKSKQTGHCKSDSVVLAVSFSTKQKDDKGTISFFEGKKIRFGKSDQVNFLSSDASEFGTFKDAIDIGTNECFGINSIDISYNNYMVPEVTIEFTDIRGISLFAPEELRHGVNNGQIRDDVAGSFFKSFFTFPYPIFKLTVKGFYGEPAVYELCCSDFRARFDCNTGNFGATAKFIGYAYSLLNDITLNALVVAPYSEYVGKKYWNDKIKDKTFVFSEDNPKPLVTIMDILKKMEKIKESLLKLNQTDNLAIKSRDLSNISSITDNIYSYYNEYFNKVIKTISEHLSKNNKKELFKKSDSQMSFALYSETNINDIELNCNSEYEKLKSKIERCSGDISFPIPKKIEIKYELLTDDLISKLNTNNLYLSKNSSDKLKYVYYYDGYELINHINSQRETINNNIKENSKKIAEKEKDIFVEILGFEPTIENITTIIMAHFETLCHCIYVCADSVNNLERTKNDIGITSSDCKMDNDIVPPFPRVDIHKNENKSDLKTIEEGWIGDLNGGLDEPEVNLINGMLKGTNEVNSIIDNATKAIQKLKDNGYTPTIVPIPLTALDLMLEKSPFGEEVDFNNLSDFAGRIGLRMFSVLGLSNSYYDYEQMGKADAINFSRLIKNYPSDFFIDRLKGNSIDSNSIIDCLSGISKNEMKGNSWAWSETDEPMINAKNKNTSFASIKYSLFKEDNTILPIQNINWDNIKKTLKNNNSTIDSDFFTSKTVDGNDNPNPYILKIDNNYELYSRYKNSMKYESKEFSYVDKLGMEINSNEYINNYFNNNEKYFCKRFSSNVKNKVISFNEDDMKKYDNSYFLNKRRLSIEDSRRNNSFNYGKGVDDDFDEFISIKRDGGSVGDSVEEFNNINTFTIPYIMGIIDGECVNEVSLFGQKEYYMQKDNYAKSFLFLYSFGLEDNDFIDYDKIKKDLLKESNHFNILPRLGILQIGAIMWAIREIRNNNNVINFIDNFISYEDIASKYDMKLDSLRAEAKNEIINYFLKWTENDFKTYQEKFEIFNIEDNNSVNLINDILLLFDGEENFSYFNKKINKKLSKKYIKIQNFYEFLSCYLNDDFFDTYISIKINNKGIKLFNREYSAIIQDLTNFIIKPCMVIKPSKYIFNNSKKSITVDLSYKKYLDSFIEKLKEIYSEKKGEDAEKNISSSNSDNNIKTALYKYIKIVWDRWLSGSEEETWSLKNFYRKHWFFIDSFYNKIGQSIKIDIVNFCSDIIYSQNENGYSLLSFLSKIYAKDRFAFHCVQNFMDLTSGDVAARKMSNLFKPIPYNKVQFEKIDRHPSFIVMYTYEYSSKLDMADGEYLSDSFDIGSEEKNLPIPITSKTPLSGYKIPAFGVSYGKQYQSYFKNIDVSMDNPIVTEQAIKSQFIIAGMNRKDGENGKNIVTLGQDLYTIYSNNSYTCTVTMMGCAWIQPLMYFQLLNVPMFRGAYLIQKVNHKITPGNMETTFVGTRMAAVTTAKVNKTVVKKLNDESSPQEVLDLMGEKADIINDCEYKFFNPLIDKNMPCMTDEELDMTLEAYEKYIGSNFNHVVRNNSEIEMNKTTISRLLGGTIKKEASTEDKLGKQLVATVLFNRYMHYGKDLTKIYYGSQHEIGDCKSDSDYINIAKEIFSKTPAIIIGQKTSVYRQVPIWNNGIKSNEYTSPKTITEHDVKSIDGYCTTNGYYALDNHKTGDKVTESFGYWQNSKYSLHHQNGNNFGHIFVSGAFKPDMEHWQKYNNKEFSDEENKKSLSELLFESIKKSLLFSKEINVKDVMMEIDNTEDNAFFVTAEPIEFNKNIFDVALNSYSNYVERIDWIVLNDSKELPIKVRIVASKDNVKNKIFAISKYEENKLTVCNSPKNLCEFFNLSLCKYYKEISTNNSKNKFIMECKNFTDLTESETWDKEVETIVFGKALNKCGKDVNIPISDGYTWDGVKSPNDMNVYGKKIQSFNYKSGNYHKETINNDNYPLPKWEENKCGNCARYVRETLMNEENGNADFKTWPLSACAYSKYLPLWGFTEVYSGFGPITKGYVAQNGDIAVVAGKLGGGKEKKYGHIHIYDISENKWISDFKANTPYCYGDEGRPFKIFRWIS